MVLLATGKRGGALGREVVNVSFPAPLFFAPPLYTPFSSSLPSPFPGTHRLQHIGPLACLENRCALFSTTALPQSSESKERETKNKTVPFQQFSPHPSPYSEAYRAIVPTARKSTCTPHCRYSDRGTVYPYSVPLVQCTPCCSLISRAGDSVFWFSFL